ncbi:response regulator [Edaphobacter aggregans]|uniref:response regulator n=1 Tax=Edaphobacter aggregans TaxID=570835 RepID=UPI001FDF8E32|nr:response regulator [Edaphobacter aggregans]
MSTPPSPPSPPGADEAIERLAQDPGYSLVLSDIMMPGTNGLALLDRISADHPGLPVIMFTAVHDIHVATSAFRRGAFDYLLKPFERLQLESVVSRAVEHSRHMRQKQRLPPASRRDHLRAHQPPSRHHA